MNDFFFHFSALSVLPFWGMMIFFPNSNRTEQIIQSTWIILPPIICYLAFLLPNIVEALAIFGDISPENLAKAMSTTWGAGLFWAYAGAFDLFVGRWMYLDAKKYSIAHVFLAPILLVTIAFGPFGFMLYALVKLGVRATNNA